MLVACGAGVLLLSGVGPVTCLGSALWGLETARACAQGGKAHALTHALYEMQVRPLTTQNHQLGVKSCRVVGDVSIRWQV